MKKREKTGSSFFKLPVFFIKQKFIKIITNKVCLMKIKTTNFTEKPFVM